MKQRVSICVWAVISALSAWLSFSAEAAAPANLFFDGFDGPSLNPIWQASLPDNAYSGSFPGGSSQTAQYVGAPAYGFETLGTNTVLRLTNSLSPLTRCGWSTTNNFTSTNFVYEVRFNTLNQSSTTSIDGFIEIWLIDATNSSRYDIVSPFGGSYDGALSFFAGSSIDTNYTETPFNYATNTWYRLRLSGFPGQNIRASFCDDTGAELTGMTFNHGAAAFSHGFKLGLSQLVGAAGEFTPRTWPWIMRNWGACPR